MAMNFKALAQNELTLSHLMNGRTQLTTKDVVDKELTIIEFDIASACIKGKDAVFPVIVFKEYPDNYYNGGALLAKVCTAWAGAFGGDIEIASSALKKEGGVKCKFAETKTQSGNNLVNVEIL